MSKINCVSIWRKSLAIRKALGPGFLLAGAAIGVSHLVQSTRAGADYGFALWWVLLFACLTKYPFLEFGPRFAASTGQNLIVGYQKLGRFPFWTYIVITIGTMFIIQAAVTIVTAGLAEQFFQLGWSPAIWSAVILSSCIILLIAGKYPGLDFTMKVIVTTLALGTLIAVLIALGAGTAQNVIEIPTPSYWNVTGLAFIIAFIGWMPIPIDSAVWHSIWVKEKSRHSRNISGLKEVLFDFNMGYFIAALLGILFFLLGALVMFGSNTTFESNSVLFSAQLVNLYGSTLGEWSKPIISIAALTTMVSTTLAVTDAFPRVISTLLNAGKSEENSASKRKLHYNLGLFIIPLVSMAILFSMTASFTALVDFAAALSFLSAPFLAWFNLKAITGPMVPQSARPGRLYRQFAFICFLLLSLFALFYLGFRIFIL